MTKMLRWLSAFAVALAVVWTVPAGGKAADPFVLHAGDHICIIGNTLAERMQYDGWLETLLHARFPKHDLVIRNLGFSGDEITTRLRSKNFGTPDEWLSGKGAPIGGYEENRFERHQHQGGRHLRVFRLQRVLRGEEGLDAFKQQLGDWITHTLAQKYNGKSAPRIVLFSPIAHEDLHNPDLPDGRENNKRLELYTKAMGEVAQARSVRFVDLFTPSRELYAAAKSPLTINGVHLNADGNRRIGEVIDRALFGAAPAQKETYLERLRQAVLDKNFHWFNRYRTTDGFATFGDRAFLTFIRGNPRDVNPKQVQVAKEDVLPTNYEVLEREVSVLDVMTGNRDKRIWALARGTDPKAADLRVLDSDTPPFINAQTNEPGKGPNGEHIFLAGEEAVQKMTIGKGLKVELFASEKEVPGAGQPGADGVRHARQALGGGLEELPALAAEDADGRQAADPRRHRRRRQGRQTDSLCRRPEQPHRLRVLQRRRDRRAGAESRLSQGHERRRPLRREADSPRRSSIPPTRTTRSTASRSTPAARCTCRKGSSIGRRSKHRGDRRCARPTAASSGSSRARRSSRSTFR